MTAMRPVRCPSLGIHKLDPALVCPWRTDACKACYAMAAYRRWRSALSTDGRRYMVDAVGRDAARWFLWAPCHFNGIPAVRIATRGEALKNRADLEHVRSLVASCPDTLWMLPTRAWRDPAMRELIQTRLMGLGNLRLLASIDRTSTQEEYDALVADGWSTMGFWARGDNPHPFAPETCLRCPKTWGGAHGATACKRCSSEGIGCFQSARKDVFLRLHS